MEKIGFIGLGIMGKPMAANLVRAGYTVFAYDIVPTAAKALAAAGAVACGSIAEAVRKADIIITMLPNSAHVKDVAFSAGGILENAKEGCLFVDMSSIAPKASREIASALKSRNIGMLDAPVSGGESGAIDGTLSIMVGGDPANFERAKPLFNIMGSSFTLVGEEVGSGNVCKLVNQVVVAVNLASMCEGLTLAKSAGVDPTKIYEAIRGGLAGSALLDAKVPMILNHDCRPGFRLNLHIKDLDNALDAGREYGCPLPFTAQIQQIFLNLLKDGEAENDHSVISKYYEKLSGLRFCEGK